MLLSLVGAGRRGPGGRWRRGDRRRIGSCREWMWAMRCAGIGVIVEVEAAGRCWPGRRRESSPKRRVSRTKLLGAPTSMALEMVATLGRGW